VKFHIDMNKYDELISQQKHPKYDLFIYNYRPNCQFNKKWDKVTTQCRGLILDKDENIIARPFKKFFNLEEYEKLPEFKKFEIYDKLDGSLGIQYPADNKWFIATRGSFISEQAMVGTEILQSKYSHINFEPQFTYLYEIIYPENRIVIDYGKMRDIVLLTIINNETGIDQPYKLIKKFADNNGIQLVKRYNYTVPLYRIKEYIKEDNKEGFVIKFDTELRVKIKYDEYKRLHRIVTGVSSKTIWDMLRNKESLYSIITNVPDEFHDWVSKKVIELNNEYGVVYRYCQEVIRLLDFNNIDKNNMKEVALFFQKFKYQSVLFAMFKNKDYGQIIWSIVKPTYEQPFKTDI